MSTDDAHIDESRLTAMAVRLGAAEVAGWSLLESKYLGDRPHLLPSQIHNAKAAIHAGDDPLGDAFCRLRSPADRRPAGATYTPLSIVRAMVDRASKSCDPALIVDPGTGSARFLVECGKRFPKAKLLGVEIDPVAAILARGHLASAGFASRSTVLLGDFRQVLLPSRRGTTLFIGNPPYVRHHLIEPKWKQWLVDKAEANKLSASTLAGLHVYFFLATLLNARKHDHGIFITAAEWLDVNYGSVVRSMLLDGLGGKSITIVDAEAMPFADAMTTAVITAFEVSSKSKCITFNRVKSVAELTEKSAGLQVGRKRLESESRWSYLTKVRREVPAGFVELGELCRVHRGQVTGDNGVWIAGPDSDYLPGSVLFPSVTKARELIQAGTVLADSSNLRRVIDIPVDLDELSKEDRRTVDRFLSAARNQGAHLSYTAKNRRAWWSVGLRKAAPVLCTYMARRSPAFVENAADARHINIAHGIYPRETIGKRLLTALVSYLSRAVHQRDGRTYAGGLVKFEPRELERFAVPGLDLLRQGLDGIAANPI